MRQFKKASFVVGGLGAIAIAAVFVFMSLSFSRSAKAEEADCGFSYAYNAWGNCWVRVDSCGNETYLQGCWPSGD